MPLLFPSIRLLADVDQFGCDYHSPLGNASVRELRVFELGFWMQREVTITGTHQGEYCDVPASGNPVCVELAAFYLFGTGETVDRLVAERIHFDNEILLRQMRGEADVQTGIGLAELAPAVTSMRD